MAASPSALRHGSGQALLRTGFYKLPGLASSRAGRTNGVVFAYPPGWTVRGAVAALVTDSTARPEALEGERNDIVRSS